MVAKRGDSHFDAGCAGLLRTFNHAAGSLDHQADRWLRGRTAVRVPPPRQAGATPGSSSAASCVRTRSAHYSDLDHRPGATLQPAVPVGPRKQVVDLALSVAFDDAGDDVGEVALRLER